MLRRTSQIVQPTQPVKAWLDSCAFMAESHQPGTKSLRSVYPTEILNQGATPGG